MTQAVDALMADLKKLSHYAPAAMRDDLYKQAIQAALAAERAAERERAALEAIDLVAFHGGSVEIEAAIRRLIPAQEPT